MKKKHLKYISLIILMIIDSILIYIEDNTMNFPVEYSMMISALLCVTTINLFKIIYDFIRGK